MTDLFSEISEPQSSSTGAQGPYSVDSSPSLAPFEHDLAGTEHDPKPHPGLIGAVAVTAVFPLIGFFAAIPVVILASVFVDAADTAGQQTAVVSGSQGGVLLCALFAAAACTWIAKHRVFSLAPIRILHLVALVALVLPTTLLARSCYEVAVMGWSHVTDAFPALKFIDKLNTMNQMEELITNVPFGLLLFSIAVVPALAEEIFFRGIIGRGLKARYGLVSGIIMTSILFGIAHLHPAHAASVIPLGITMHVLYVATRSFWAPVLFHFCNNAFAVVGATLALKQQQGQPVQIAEAPVFPWWMILACALSVGAWYYLLSVTRTRLLKTDGTDWDPGYESTETPRHIETHRHYPEMPLGPTIAAVLCGGLFLVALVGMGLVNMEGMNQDALILLLR